MKILWLVNIPLPEVSIILKQPVIPFGGWLVNTSQQISRLNGTSLSIIFPGEKFQIYNGEKIKYIMFSNSKTSEHFEKILKDEKPDLVHIFGTEFPHTLEMIKICKKLSIKYVISIQGLVSAVSKYYVDGLPKNVVNRFTFRDLVKYDNISLQMKKFKKKGWKEKQSLKLAENIIGRTTWDKENVLRVNPIVNYYHCNETLRNSFYEGMWKYNNCEKFSIFLSQGSYPIKGLHFMLHAMKILKNNYDVKLYIAGTDITKSETYKDRLKISSYGKYIKELIDEYGLNECVHFLGVIHEKEMYERYLKSNVFVCSSTIENSPNSLGEAMLLGVPSVASYVGGIPDLLEHKKEGFLYQADAPEMLAYYIKYIFEQGASIENITNKSREKAMEMYNVQKNLERLLQIYKDIIGTGVKHG